MNQTDFSSLLNQTLLNDSALLDRLCQRMVHRISAGKSEGNETITQVGEFHFTRNQIDRFKKAFIFLCSNDEEFRQVMRWVLRKEIKDIPIRDPLNKAQMVKRILEYGALAFKYQGKMVGFWVDEVYGIFGEYSRNQVKQMLCTNGLWIKDVTKKNPKTGKQARGFVLDI